jgi:nickel-dependent lactate racemase
MAKIDLKYGSGTIGFEYDEGRFDILETKRDDARALTDVQIGERFDRPIASAPIEERVKAGESVLIVVPDATRQTGCGQVVNLLVRRLIAAGIAPFDISIIFATGIHRPVTESEKGRILTPFIVQRIKTLDHRPRDLMQIVRVGETSGGIPIELNRAVIENDHVVLVGGINFHYFAGFTGGRKLICPGLASSKTISATHKLAIACDTLERRLGVGPGLLDGNAVHEVFTEAASTIGNVFCISTQTNDAGEVTELHCGDLVESHRVACEALVAANEVTGVEKRGLVVASCGGFPHDINLIQAHKTLDAAAAACADGGTIVLLAECSEGLGRSDFLDWFAAGNSRDLARTLCEKYQVNGQTAWSLLTKTERFDVQVVTSLDAGALRRMRMTKYSPKMLKTAGIDSISSGYVIPDGARILIR